jgi:hypothetical protein
MHTAKTKSQVFRYLILIWIVGIHMHATAQSFSQHPISYNCNNYIHISGTSNINQFSFRFNTERLLPSGQDLVTEDSGNYEICVPVRDFQASNPMMFKDFLELIKASEYPLIKIRFTEKQLDLAQQVTGQSLTEIRITLAGISRIYKIRCNVFNCMNNMFISGEKGIRLSDFHLVPPVKLNGLVKVHDEINVNFGFIITFGNENPISAAL